MGYFLYTDLKTLTVFVGSTRKEMNAGIDAVVAQGYQRDPSAEIEKVNELVIPCFYPLFNEKHFMDMKLLDDVCFQVNANAFHALVAQVENIDNMKIGPLYLLRPNYLYLLRPNIAASFYVPSVIVEAMKKYDWKQHRRRVDSMLRKREDSLHELEQKGFLARMKQ